MINFSWMMNKILFFHLFYPQQSLCYFFWIIILMYNWFIFLFKKDILYYLLERYYDTCIYLLSQYPLYKLYTSLFTITIKIPEKNVKYARIYKFLLRSNEATILFFINMRISCDYTVSSIIPLFNNASLLSPVRLAFLLSPRYIWY